MILQTLNLGPKAYCQCLRKVSFVPGGIGGMPALAPTSGPDSSTGRKECNGRASYIQPPNQIQKLGDVPSATHPGRGGGVDGGIGSRLR